jgi:hypothetical protein
MDGFAKLLSDLNKVESGGLWTGRKVLRTMPLASHMANKKEDDL